MEAISRIWFFLFLDAKCLIFCLVAFEYRLEGYLLDLYCSILIMLLQLLSYCIVEIKFLCKLFCYWVDDCVLIVLATLVDFKALTSDFWNSVRRLVLITLFILKTSKTLKERMELKTFTPQIRCFKCTTLKIHYWQIMVLTTYVDYWLIDLLFNCIVSLDAYLEFNQK